jgi:putative oxidoreductase
MDKVFSSPGDSRRRVFDISLLILRIVVGIIMSAHGAQKMFGLFGGFRLAATVQHMGSIGYLVSIGEFFGGLGLVLGFLTRFSSLSLIVIQIGAIHMVHWKNGFFLGEKPGFEYNFALIGLLLALLIAGPGDWAIVRWFPRIIPPLKRIITYIE